MSLYQEKMRQACQIVQEEGVDVWLIIARETVMNNDPVLQLISPVDFGGMTCVFITDRVLPWLVSWITWAWSRQRPTTR